MEGIEKMSILNEHVLYVHVHGQDYIQEVFHIIGF